MKFRLGVSGILMCVLAVVATGKPSPGGSHSMVKLTQYDRAEYADLAVGPDGTIHAVFTDRPAWGKPTYLYYRSSADGGKTWSAAVNLSDDETGEDASFARLVMDGKGRIYAIWKYVAMETILDGPGGVAGGRIVFRSLDGGTWSKRVPLGDAKIAGYSWFASVDPGGVLHVVWSQMAPDAAAMQGAYYWYANLVRMADLDGSAVSAVRDVVQPKPIVTETDARNIRAAGGTVPYEDMSPKKDGLINLRGFVDASGTVRFVAEHPGIQDGPSSGQTGKRIVYWDGEKMNVLYTFEKYATYNNFNDPPALLLDAQGKMHFIRAPEKSELPCVRDYALAGPELGDFTSVIAPVSGPGKLTHWQAHQLPGGRMAVTAELSQKGGYEPDDLEMYVSCSDGGGKWSEPVRVTNNQARQNASTRNTVGRNSISTSNSYVPRFASVVAGADGKPNLLIVNTENTILGVTTAGVTGTGREVATTSTGSVDNPAVFFLKM